MANLIDTTINGNLTVTSSTEATNINTGAVRIYGGLGVAGDVWSTKYNNLTLTAAATGFTIAGGTTSRTLTVTGNATISGGAHSGTNTGNQTITSGNGMNFTTGSGNVTITLGGPSSITSSSTNSVATASHTHAIVGEALTKTDDTNVTLTLGGTPATGLVKATSLTLGWSGTLAVSRGGTGLATTSAKHAFMGPEADAGAPSFRAIVAGDLPVASATAAGIVTTGAQTFSGNKTISGDLSATRVYNAVWNDMADFLEVDEDIDIKYGKAYFRDNNGKVRKTNKRNSYTIGIASDTFGFGVGRKDENIKQIPIAIGGWVLACVDSIYKAGTPLIATKDGNLTKASILDKILFPERIIAIFDRVEKEETWNGVEVKGRHWVKVK